MSEKAPTLKAGHPAERAVYATLDGRLVEEGDPAANQLVVGAGGVVTEKMAARYAHAPGAPVPSDAPQAPQKSGKAEAKDEKKDDDEDQDAKGGKGKK